MSQLEKLGNPDQDCPLGRSELLVIRLISADATTKQVASVLGLSASAVRSHKMNALKKLNANNVADAVEALKDNLWWDLEPPEKPLREDHPFLQAYLREFDASRWPHSPDARAERGMWLALEGHRNMLPT